MGHREAQGHLLCMRQNCQRQIPDPESLILNISNTVLYQNQA